MHLLILGGTVFLGRHVVDAARARGHRVTLFNRGKSRPDAFPDVDQIHGDRTTDEGLAALDGQTFDAVLDTCGYVPRVVRKSAERLAGRAGTYCFVSSVSVYADWPEASPDEDARIATIPNPDTEEVTGETYGALKALCEQAAEAAFPGRTLVIRPGLIVGPHDPSDRFTYWPHRIAAGGDVVAPGGPDLPTQWIDVRDLARWTVQLLEEGRVGTFNADGPVTPLGTLLDACVAASGSDARVHWIDETFLTEREVRPWIGLPLWIPGLRGRADGGATRIDRAVAAGLTHRPIAETVADTLAWDASRPQENAWRATLTPAREAEVLREWRDR